MVGQNAGLGGSAPPPVLQQGQKDFENKKCRKGISEIHGESPLFSACLLV